MQNVSEVIDSARDCLDGSGLYEIEKSYAVDKLDNFSFVVIGPPIVGKSCLVNAVTGKNMAKVRGGFASVTKTIDEYYFGVDDGVVK